MTKPKAQTIQQRFGFMDDDLKKPKHDEMMLWLNDSIDEKLLDWLGLSKDWTQEEIAKSKSNALAHRQGSVLRLQKDLEREKAYPDYDPYTTYADLTLEEKDALNEKYKREKTERIAVVEKKIEKSLGPIEIPSIPSKPPARITTKQWEKPIKSNDYIIGFIDMAIHYELPVLDITLEMTENGWNTKWEIHYVNSDGYGKDNRIYFEAKTEIPSLGELIRQVNMYKSYSTTRIFVVAPDDTHASLLKEQDIGFIKFS